MDIAHQTIVANGIDLHVASVGSGPPLLLLHGWPEFWLTWEPVMLRLADRFTLIAPDLRGFGASGKGDPGPNDRAGADVHAADMVALLDALDLDQGGLVAHDVGAYVGQSLGRKAPGRFKKLFFIDCPYPGIGGRAARPDHLKEIWYQSFNQQAFAAEIVGATRASCEAYIGHFLRHWAGRPDAFDDVLDRFVDNFMAPGNLQRGFNWYISANAGRIATLKDQAPPRPKITVPTRIRWGEQGTLMPYAGPIGSARPSPISISRRSHADIFPHRENPDLAAAEIAAWFLPRT